MPEEHATLKERSRRFGWTLIKVGMALMALALSLLLYARHLGR
jgi:hypothetical protein